MQQWWCDDAFVLKLVIDGVLFTILPLFLRVSLILMNMQIR